MTRPSPEKPRQRADKKPHPAPGAERHAPDPEEEALGSTRVVESIASSPAPNAASPSLGEAEAETPTPAARPKKQRPNPTTLGEYRILRKLGEGAMGAVYLARQEGFERDVALKVLFPHVAGNPKLVERLYREGRVMGQLDHPNLVQAYAIGEDQGWHYVAMEFVEGESLQSCIDRFGTIPVDDAVHVALACLRALDYAHKLGVIHRDIKPDNVLIDRRRGVVKVADLGMVKTDEEEMSLTQTGHAVGTPWYMPLEQARNAKEIDGRSDIYALGCMVYCMLVGHPPFVGKTIVEVIQAKESGTFPPARKFNPDVPEKLDLILLKMTAKQPKHRYQSCAEAIQDLVDLGLAGQTLNFLRKPRTKVDPAAPTAPTVRVDSSGGDVTVVDSAELDVWHLLVKVEGNEKSRKLTTSQILKMLQEGTVGPTAKISRTPGEGYRSIATYKEFAEAAQRQRGQKAIAISNDRYRNLYKKIEDKEVQREKEEESERDAETRNYWLGIFWRSLAGVVGVGAVGYFLFWLARGFLGVF